MSENNVVSLDEWRNKRYNGTKSTDESKPRPIGYDFASVMRVNAELERELAKARLEETQRKTDRLARRSDSKPTNNK